LIEGGEAHHIASVKRLEAGDEITLFDGHGRELLARIAEVSRKGGLKVRVTIEDAAYVDREPSVQVTIASAVPKGKRAEMMIQKCAELGLQRFIPVQCARSVVNVMTRAESRTGKWRKISTEASKQCGRNRIMEILSPCNFERVLRLGGHDLYLIATEDRRASPLKHVLKAAGRPKKLLWLIGPEGGFTEAEVTHAVRAGFRPVLLAPSTLRVETAAIAAMAMVVYESYC